jgi:hypothetical protein
LLVLLNANGHIRNNPAASQNWLFFQKNCVINRAGARY